MYFIQYLSSWLCNYIHFASLEHFQGRTHFLKIFFKLAFTDHLPHGKHEVERVPWFLSVPMDSPWGRCCSYPHRITDETGWQRFQFTQRKGWRCQTWAVSRALTLNRCLARVFTKLLLSKCQSELEIVSLGARREKQRCQAGGAHGCYWQNVYVWEDSLWYWNAMNWASSEKFSCAQDLLAWIKGH